MLRSDDPRFYEPAWLDLYWQNWWTGYSNGTANILSIVGGVLFCLLVALLFWQGGKIPKLPKPPKWLRISPRTQKILFGLLALWGVFGWFHYGRFHGHSYIHTWEHYHYYVGAKYFPELGYDRLYACSIVAESEFRKPRSVLRRTIRDLGKTNLMIPARDTVTHPERCKSHFSEKRWAQFRSDVQFFRRVVGVARWKKALHDHGYNATPWWTFAGRLFAEGDGLASRSKMSLLGALDPFFVIASFVMLAWAFGIRATAAAAFALAMSYAARFYWNGGGFMRYDYHFALIAGVCLWKREKYGLGTVALVWASASRIFPVFALVGPVLVILTKRFSKGSFSPPEKRILLSGMLAGALLAPAPFFLGTSPQSQGGFEVLGSFTRNTIKHTKTPLTNHMGLPTILSWRPADRAEKLKDGDLTDPFSRWKEKRLENKQSMRPVFWMLCIFSLWLVWRASKGLELYESAALSALVLIPVFTELTCYYYAFIVLGAAFASRSRPYALALVAFGFSMQILKKVPLWLDERFVVISLASLLFSWGTAWWLLRTRTDFLENFRAALGRLRARSVGAHPQKK